MPSHSLGTRNSRVRWLTINRRTRAFYLAETRGRKAQLKDRAQHMPDRRFTVQQLEVISRYLRVRIEDMARANADSPHVQALLLEANNLDAQRALVLESASVSPR